jgi:hypothetical protein
MRFDGLRTLSERTLEADPYRFPTDDDAVIYAVNG